MRKNIKFGIGTVKTVLYRTAVCAHTQRAVGAPAPMRLYQNITNPTQKGTRLGAFDCIIYDYLPSFLWIAFTPSIIGIMETAIRIAVIHSTALMCVKPNALDRNGT